MMNRWPVRTKIAAACGLITSILLLVLGVGTLTNIHQSQIEAADVELATEARLIARLLGGGGLPSDGAEAPPVDFEPWVAFAVVDAERRIRRSSDALPFSAIERALEEGGPLNIEGPGSWRVQAFPEPPQIIVVGYSLEESHRHFLGLVFAYLIGGPLAAAMVAFAGWWIAGSSLGPVRRLTETARAIGPTNLHHRVPVPETGDEVQDLASVLNSMLTRLDRSYQQAERFAADASHELRTPLTIMRGEIEALLRRGDLSPPVEARLVSLQEETQRLERVAENLLLLARLDSTASALPHAENVVLGNLAAEVCEDGEMLASARGVTIESKIPEGLWITGDPELLRRLLLNLLDNATKYNQPGGKVRCHFYERDETIEISVANTGPEIPAELRPRLFDRFFRADDSHLHTGHGLGLAICQEIARAHRGEITLQEDSPEGWNTFRVTLPKRLSGK